MEMEASEIIDKIMIKKFPEFNVRFLELMRKVLEKVIFYLILASKIIGNISKFLT